MLYSTSFFGKSKITLIIFRKIIQKLSDLQDKSIVNLIKQLILEFEPQKASKEQLCSDMYDRFGAESSWAIWGEDYHDIKYIWDNYEKINPNYIIVGMNQSKKVEKYGIFHTEKCSAKLASLFNNQQMSYAYGGFLTDLLNKTTDGEEILYEPDSEELVKYLKSTEGYKNLQIARKKFETKYITLQKYNGGKRPAIIALGKLVHDTLKDWDYSSTTIPHPGAMGGKDEYNAKSMKSLGLEHDSDLSGAHGNRINRSKRINKINRKIGLTGLNNLVSNMKNKRIEYIEQRNNYDKKIRKEQELNVRTSPAEIDRLAVLRKKANSQAVDIRKKLELVNKYIDNFDNLDKYISKNVVNMKAAVEEMDDLINIYETFK